MKTSPQNLAALQNHKVAVLGFGNQGEAQALNLRDSGIEVIVGASAGRPSWEKASAAGFQVASFSEAAQACDVLMWLLPDTLIPKVYLDLHPSLTASAKYHGFSHGFAFHFGFLEKFASHQYFLVAPKGAGTILRQRYLSGEGLPGFYAVAENSDARTTDIAIAYAHAIGCGRIFLKETSFQEETECDLFGEQVVLCGGILELMQSAYALLREKGHSKEMAFFETCFEAKLILDLWIQNGPEGLSRRISPTAFYGGFTRGKRLITEETRREMKKLFEEIRSGDFANEWMKEVENQSPKLAEARESLKHSELNATYKAITDLLAGRSPAKP